MNIENTEVFGFEAAIRAMRNPLNSWDRSDSQHKSFHYDKWSYWLDDNANTEGFILGKKDKELSQKLSKSGTEHRKHLRFIRVWSDWTLPRYIWAEVDTYKHIDKISCSTMHTLMKSHVSKSDFEQDNVPNALIEQINNYIDLYNNTKDKEERKKYLIACKNILPEGFLQKRTISTNYECLLSMYLQRKNHRLPEWRKICNWILDLPYFIELTGVEIE